MGGVYSPPSSGAGELPLPPFPPNDPRWDQRDRFGLAVWPPSLLAESTEERRARIAIIERLAADLFKTAVTHLGRPEARRLFADVTKAPWKKGKQPHRERNDQLLGMYDNAVRENPNRIRSIPRLLAEQLHPNNPRSVPSTEKQIRRPVTERNRRQKAMEATYQRFPRSLLDQANSPERDI